MKTASILCACSRNVGTQLWHLQLMTLPTSAILTLLLQFTADSSEKWLILTVPFPIWQVHISLSGFSPLNATLNGPLEPWDFLVLQDFFQFPLATQIEFTNIITASQEYWSQYQQIYWIASESPLPQKALQSLLYVHYAMFIIAIALRLTLLQDISSQPWNSKKGIPPTI